MTKLQLAGQNLVLLGDLGEVFLDLPLIQNTESGIRLADHADLNAVRLEVYSEHTGQTGDGQLDRFLLRQVGLVLLFQIAVGLQSLGTHAAGLEPAEVASWVRLVNAGSDFIVVSDQHHAAAERTHLGILRVHLVDIRNSTTQHIHGHFVAVLVAEVGGLVSGLLHL